MWIADDQRRPKIKDKSFGVLFSSEDEVLGVKLSFALYESIY